MAIALSNPTTGQTVEGNRRKWRGTVTFDSSYPTGGEAIDLDLLGWSHLDYGSLQGDDGYVGKIDIANTKAMVYGVGNGAAVVRSVSKVCAFGSFTDNTNTTGYIDFTDTIPAGSQIMHWKSVVATGFTGDTTAVMQVGIAGDLDRFSADTAQSVLAAGTVGSGPLAADVMDGISAAVTARVTVTGAADFTSISAGSMTVTIYYIDPAAAATAMGEVANTTSLSGVVMYGELVGY